MKKVKRDQVKVIWMQADKVRYSDYFETAAAAERFILKARDRGWGKPSVLYWSENLSRYVSVPEK